MSQRPVIALIYDFDKTLCTKNMQEYEFIPDKIGMDTAAFWNEASDLAEQNKMDRILAYMYLMVKKANQKELRISRADFIGLGAKLEFYPGVADWFAATSNFGAAHGVDVEHYIISSGLAEIIEGSAIFSHFTKVFASEFLYDQYGAPCWPKVAVNYTTKTQFLFRISKNVTDISCDTAVNQYMPVSARRINFANMIYIGDGLTDVPCMRLVKKEGGHSIAVYEKRSDVEELLAHERVNNIYPADYSQTAPLYARVCDIIETRAAIERLKPAY